MLERKMIVAAGLVSAAAVGVLALRAFALADEPKRGPQEGVRPTTAAPQDVRKSVIETPVKRVVAATAGNVTPNGGVSVPAASALRPDVGKGRIELPAKEVLALKTAVAKVPLQSLSANPKVEPGKVRWHKSFADAVAAAKGSGKPVLLFHMMGNLDDQFC